MKNPITNPASDSVSKKPIPAKKKKIGNAEIKRRYDAGESVEILATESGKRVREVYFILLSK